MSLAICFKRKANAGVTLAEIVVSLGISGILIAIAYQQYTQIQQSFASIEIDADINDIAQRIQKAVNCETTLAAPSPIKLRDKHGGRLFKDHAFGGVFSGSEQINEDYFAQSAWSGNEVSIRLAKKSKSSLSFAKDPLTGRALGFSLSRMQIFGSPPTGIPLCPKNTLPSGIAQVTNIQVRDISPFLGNPLNTTVYNTYLRPIAAKLGCHEYCRSINHMTGFAVEWTDLCGYTTNPAGDMTGVLCPPGDGFVQCNCLL